MAETIYKFSLGQKVNQVIELEVPVTFELLSARIQGPSICIWGTVDKSPQYSKTIRIAIVGTGHEMPEANGTWKFMTSLETPAKEIYHIFEDSLHKFTSRIYKEV